MVSFLKLQAFVLAIVASLELLHLEIVVLLRSLSLGVISAIALALVLDGYIAI